MPLEQVREEREEEARTWKEFYKQELPPEANEIKLDHLKTRIPAESFLVKLGALEDHHITQVIKPELLSVMRGIASLYFLAHPNDLSPTPIPLNSTAIFDMESRGYDFVLVPESKLLDYWFREDIDDSLEDADDAIEDVENEEPQETNAPEQELPSTEEPPPL